ncbi:DUF104 domain-containing protein [Candidatus Woesearchaeota archaeon]|nr:DUF104 domain-containing protein [Candidatus Woesearchaeota archaeon]
MVTIDGIWKKGTVLPLSKVKVVDGTVVTILIPEKKKKKITSLAGIWKDDDETYETFMSVYRERRAPRRIAKPIRRINL